MINKDDYILLVYQNLKNEISNESFDLLNELTVSDPELARIRMEIEQTWDLIEGDSRQNEMDKDEPVAYQKLKARISHSPNNGKVKHLLKVAAMVLAIAGIWWLLSTKKQTVFYGQRGGSEIVLSDHSKVWLRENSRLEILEISAAHRVVQLEGEAYFEIQKNTNRSFKITTQKTQIEVLGTRFLVKEKTSELKTYVVVDEGTVRFTTIDTSHSIVLTNKMGAIYDPQYGITSHQEYFPNLASWKSGQYLYDNTPIGLVLEELALVFDVDIVLVNSELQNCKINGLILGKNAKQVLSQIAEQFHMSVSHSKNKWILDQGICHE